MTKMEAITATIIPMEVTDFVENYYILQSPDRSKAYKLPEGVVDMVNGRLIAVDEKTFIKLIISDAQEDAEKNPHDASIYDRDQRETLCDENPPSDFDSTTSSDGHNASEDRHNWTYDETLCLIEAMGSHMDELNHPKKRRFVFTNIANDLQSSGFAINATTCNNKWKNLLRSYKAAKDNKNKTGRGPSRFHFFDKMDDLLGEKPSNKCAHSLESSNVNTVEAECMPAGEEPPSSPSSATTADEAPRGPPNKRARRNTAPKQDFVTLKKEEYQKRQTRHNEKMTVEKQKLEVEREKVSLLKKLLGDDAPKVDAPKVNN